jgi:hypothetical protein
MEIENFEDLIEFIENNDLSIEQIAKLTKETIDLHIMFYSDKNELMTDLKAYWKQWNHTTERPLFLGADYPFDFKKFWNSRMK